MRYATSISLNRCPLFVARSVYMRAPFAPSAITRRAKTARGVTAIKVSARHNNTDAYFSRVASRRALICLTRFSVDICFSALHCDSSASLPRSPLRSSGFGVVIKHLHY